MMEYQSRRFVIDYLTIDRLKNEKQMEQFVEIFSKVLNLVVYLTKKLMIDEQSVVVVVDQEYDENLI